jgi:hypothetical protein
MNQKRSKLSYSILKCITFLFSIVLLFNGCKKDSEYDGQESLSLELKQFNINIQKLKSAYLDSIGSPNKQINDINFQTLSKIIGTSNVDWSTLSIHSYPDSMKVIEFEMPMDTVSVTVNEISLGDTINEISKTKAVFFVHNDTIKRAFYMKIIEDAGSKKLQSVYKDLHYQQIPYAFKGQIMYFTLAKTLINGYYWKNGLITHSIENIGGNQPITQIQSNKSTRKDNSLSYACHPQTITQFQLHVIPTLPNEAPIVFWTSSLGTIQVCGWEGSLPSGGYDGPGGVGGGTSGGSDPSPPTTPPCPGTVVSYVKGRRVNVPAGCPTVPPTQPTITPYERRRLELISQLSINPTFLIPCDQLAELLKPYQSYGSMFQQVASFIAPASVQNRIDELQAQNGPASLFADNFYIQSLKNSAGSVVNTDFFPVRITQMPPGETAASLTEYFRTNINTFITTGENFTPYNFGNVNDTNLFNQAGPASLGALVHIKMINDGTVVESDYQVTATSAQFKFTTMTSPLDFNHPISGNREFGVYQDPSRPGEFTFYTMGIDRVYDVPTAIGDFFLNGFEQADQLWTNMQQNMINHIIATGGQATFYTNHNAIARPKWADVQQYLNGNITLAELKRRMGC